MAESSRLDAKTRRRKAVFRGQLGRQVGGARRPAADGRGLVSASGSFLEPQLGLHHLPGIDLEAHPDHLGVQQPPR